MGRVCRQPGTKEKQNDVSPFSQEGGIDVGCGAVAAKAPSANFQAPEKHQASIFKPHRDNVGLRRNQWAVRSATVAGRNEV
jgi:hypothetical protein